MENNSYSIQKIAYGLIVLVIGFFILTEMKQILYPIALAMLFSYLLLPLVNFLEKKIKFPRVLAIVLYLLIGVVIFSGIINLLALQIRVFIKDFADFKIQAIQNLQNLQNFIDIKFNFSAEQQELWLQEQVTLILDKSGDILKTLAKGATGTIEALIFIPIFTFFMLFFRDRGESFILQLAKKNKKDLTKNLLQQISKVIVKYMGGVITVVIILAISHSIVLSIIGVKYAIALALVAAILSFIPYFGTIVSTIIPLSFSLILSTNPYEPFFVIIYFLIITFIDHNILTPTITGGNVNLNPLVTILGLILAAEIWGIPGMIVIMPTLAVLKIICDNIDSLKPYGYILGIEQHGFDFSKLKKRIKNKTL